MKHLTRKNIPCPRAFMWIRAIRFPNLCPGETQTITITLWADNTADENTAITLRLVSDEALTPAGENCPSRSKPRTQARW